MKLRLLKDELPELIEHSTSYGGEWLSDWVVGFTQDGTCSTLRLRVPGGSDEKERAQNSARLAGFFGVGSIYAYNYVAWAYKKEIANTIDAAMSASKEASDGK